MRIIQESKRQTLLELLFYSIWSAVFWLFGALLLLTGIIPSGAPVSMLTVLAFGALAHGVTASYMSDSGHERFEAFRRTLTSSWRCAVWRGVIAGTLDLAVTAGLFMAYPLLPDVNGGWAVAIMMCILLLPPYPVLFVVLYWFTRSSRT